ncbi:MAG: PAS domain-containing protein [Myxococcales bacterium]
MSQGAALSRPVQEAMFERILDHTHVMAVLLDPGFDFVWVNRAYADSCQHPPDFFIGKNHFALYPNAENEAIFRKVRDTGEPFFVEARPFTFPDQPERGVTHWDWSLIPTRDERGAVTGLVFTLVEVTRRVRAEEQLRQSESDLRAIIEFGQDVFIRFDLDLRFRYVSPTITRRGRRGPQEALGKTYREAGYSENEAAFFERLLRAAIEQHTVQSAEYTALDRWGEERHLETSVYPELDALGRSVAVVAVTRDVTERTRADRERDELRAGLAQTERLASMGVLAAGLAHEINNPLSYVLYNLESLVEDLPQLAELMRRCRRELAMRAGEEVVAAVLGDAEDLFSTASIQDLAERLQDAHSGSLRLKALAKSLSTFARVEEAALVPVDLQSCAEHALVMASNELKFRAQVVKSFTRVPTVLGTEGKLAQVFLNLLISAAHSIEEGHVDQNEVRVRTWCEDDRVFAEVADTGPLLSNEERELVFEPFRPARGGGLGAGLGLSICKRIVEELGGTIACTSSAGAGTRFRMSFPRSSPGAQPGEPALREVAGAAVPRARILVVDDEAGVRSAVARMLRDDCEVVGVASGEEGRSLLERDDRFDLVYCDLMMPRTSGMDLHAWAVKKDPALAARFVFITGGAFTPGATAYLATCGNPRMDKPFESAEFRKRTKALLEELKAARA